MYMKGILILSNKWNNRYLELAEQVASWSKDPSSKIGSVAVGDKGQILSQGYNGFPRGVNDSDCVFGDDARSNLQERQHARSIAAGLCNRDRPRRLSG